MTNRFEANDPMPKKANRFEQNDPTVPTAPVESKDATRHYTVAEAAKAAASNLGKSAVSFGSSVRNAWLEPTNALYNMAYGAQEIPGAVAETARHPIVAAKAIGQHYSDAYGGWDNTKRQVAEHPVEALMDASTVFAGVGGLARLGATGARAAGATRAADFIANEAAGANRLANATNPLNAVRPVARGVGHVVRGAVNAVRQPERIVLRAAGDRAPAVLHELEHVRPIVPGSNPTAAEAAVRAGSTRTAALGHSAEKRFSDESMVIHDAQNAARNHHLDTVGQTPAVIDARIAQREADRLHDNTSYEGVMASDDSRLQELMQSPSTQRAFAHAREKAAERREPFSVGKTIPAHQIPDPYGQNLPPIDVPDQWAQYSGADLHRVKMAFDDAIKNPEIFGLGADDVREIRRTRAEFIDWVEQDDKIPGYRVARERYRYHSRAINQMESAQHIKRVLNSPLQGEDIAQQRAAAFAAAVNPNSVLPNSNVRRATGEQRYRQLRDLHTPEQMAVFQRVNASLAIAKRVEQQANKASQHKSVLGTPAADPRVASPHGITTRVIDALTEAAMHHARDTVGRAQLHPAEAAVLLRRALERQARLDGRSRNLHRVGNALNIPNRYPAVYNALQSIRDDKEQRSK